VSGVLDELRDTAQSMRWQDVVDIVLLTLVAWRMYAWLKGTVALQVAVGMLTIVVAAFVATDVGLVLTAYVLRAIGAVALLMTVVIFKDEIRRALGRASPLRWWRERRALPTASGVPSVYSPLAEGLFELSRKKIGALVVVPRRDPLDEWLTGGTEIDANVTPELLEALFHTASPVHDGAVVVDGSRLRLAGAFLPLSTTTALPQSHGTRHRAAVGLTEKCDALALAVSEERGEVSLSQNGEIAAVPPSAAALARRLDDLVREPRRAARAGRRKGKRRRELFRDMLVRVVIFAGVIAAWHSVAGEATRSSVIVKSVPVELRDVPPGLDFDAPKPNEVQVVLRGPRRLLMDLDPGDVHASIDLSGLQSSAPVDLPVKASGPSGITIVRTMPAKVQVGRAKR
jgi:uncharacterized protein (TIGR00159 family)